MKRVEYVGNSENIYDQQKKSEKGRNTLAGDDIDAGTKTYVRVIEKHCLPVKSRFRSFTARAKNQVTYEAENGSAVKFYTYFRELLFDHYECIILSENKIYYLHDT